MPVQPVPDRYNTVTPYLAVWDVPKLIAFVQQVFGAVETEVIRSPEGVILHAEVRIGNSIIMMGSGPERKDPFRSMLYVYTEDTDAAYDRAMQAGATSVMEPSDQYYGDRNACVSDAFGNQWWIATHKEDVSEGELIRRAAARKRTA